jgi:glyoxylate reductase
MKIFITREIPNHGVELLRSKGYTVAVSPHDRVLSKQELVAELKKGQYDAVLCLLTDKIDGEVFDATGSQCKIFANFAVGFDNIDVQAARERGVMVANTPGVLSDSVAEFAFAMILSIAHRIPEGDRFSRAGKYHGWEPELLLGTDVAQRVLGILGLGRIGSRVAHQAVKGFGMKVLYYDVKRNEDFERESGVDSTGSPQAEFRADPNDIFRESDFISVHVPLMESTRHMVNAERLKLMKPTAYLVNTSRGPIVDEAALRDALKAGTIRGAAIDVWEHEPELTPGLTELDNIILTPHIASATEETRQEMGEVAAKNIIEALEGRTPPNLVIT